LDDNITAAAPSDIGEQSRSLKGSAISAVDLVKGIGICAGLRSVNVEGATGNINTNFKGKAQAAIDEIKNGDVIYQVWL